MVCMAADRGLAGAFNSAVIRTAEREVQAARSEGRDYALVTIGRKSETYFSFRNYPIEATFEKSSCARLPSSRSSSGPRMAPHSTSPARAS